MCSGPPLLSNADNILFFCWGNVGHEALLYQEKTIIIIANYGIKATPFDQPCQMRISGRHQ